MNKRLVHIGDEYNYWKVIELSGTRALCLCLGCNKVTRKVRNCDLRGGFSKSCGCMTVQLRSSTMQERYGSSFYTQTAEFQKQKDEANLQKFGTTNTSSLPQIKKKIKQTNLEKYGVSCPLATPEVVQKTQAIHQEKRENYPEWKIQYRLKDGTPLQTVCEKYNVEKANAYRVFHKFGEEAFLRYCRGDIRKSSLEVAFIELIKDYFPGVEHYNKKPAELEDNYRPDFRLEKNGRILHVNVDGLYWHSELDKSPKYHCELRESFDKSNLSLFQFRENELFLKPDIVKSMILNYFGVFDNKYNARECIVAKASLQEAQAFFDSNHLMGAAPVMTCYFLKSSSGDAVAAMGVRKLKNDKIDIVRFATRIGCSVRGGFSKLLKHIIKTYNPEQITSFCDLRYSSGASYKKIGFKREKVSLGWQWTDFKDTYNRLRCKANMDARKLSQAEQAKELGWYKIYDAGQAKYVLETRS